MKGRIIFGMIVTAIALTVVMILPKEEKIEEYEILDNALASYKYINSYEEYKKFISKKDDNRINKDLTEQDFKNKKYLFYTLPVDSCTETIEKDELKKVDNKYKIYFDVAYSCGVCPIEKETYVYEVTEELEVEAYTYYQLSLIHLFQ